MFVETILHQFFDSVIHKTRIQSLIPVINGIIISKQLNLTQLGRSLDVPAKERGAIRRVDRLLANSYYQDSSIEIYKTIAQRVVGNQGRPIIIVDWTGIPNSRRTANDGEHCALRASLLAEGRSLTLYEEVHPKAKENNPLIHEQFLKNLKSLLPSACCPYIVTDGGFKNPWFRAVAALGWDYIGRIRGQVNYNEGSGFKSLKNLFPMASETPKYLGNFAIAKNKPLKTNCYIYTHKLQGRKKLTKNGTICQHPDSKNYSSSYREPWILVSSLNGFSAPKRVVKIYKWRMTIESGFRDTKSTEFGLSFKENKTIKSKRYVVWLMLSALASLIAWIVGYCAERKNLHYDFQANTYRHRRVLSFFYLGCQIIRKKIQLSIDLEWVQREAWDNLAWSVQC